MPEDLIIFAMKKAVEANKRTMQYIKGILNNWSKKGIKTLIDAQKEDEQFKDKNTKEKIKPNKLIGRDYTDFDFNKLYANGE